VDQESGLVLEKTSETDRCIAESSPGWQGSHAGADYPVQGNASNLEPGGVAGMMPSDGAGHYVPRLRPSSTDIIGLEMRSIQERVQEREDDIARKASVRNAVVTRF